jgi:hypothetical protein
MKLTTPARLARAAGITSQAIDRALKRPLSAARVGRRVDLDHPAVLAWLRERGLAVEDVELVGGRSASREIAAALGAGATVDLEQLLDRTLREVLDAHGTESAFTDWLRARKTLAEARRHELALEEDEGRLIERELVRVHVFGLLEQLHNRLLSDVCQTLTLAIVHSTRANEDLEVTREKARKILSKTLEETRDRVTKTLRKTGKRPAKETAE